jgi:6-phosphogluconate dehydrogenase
LPSEVRNAMQLGMVGLGRMGANLVRRLLRGGHRCVVFDVNPASVERLRGEGAVGAASLDDLGRPADPAEGRLGDGAGRGRRPGGGGAGRAAGPGDVVIDGGNSYCRDDVRRAQTLAARGIHYLDVGTSGGCSAWTEGSA